MTILQAESATAICQRALGWAEHRNTFDSLEDASQLARECRLRYDIRRRAVLEGLDWRFARRRRAAQAVEADATPPEYPFAWARPPEHLRIRGMFAATSRTPLRHVIEDVIYTAEGGPLQVVFTYDASNPALFPPVFTTALEFLLASEFAMLYARSVNRAEIMLANFRRAMEEADATEAAERSEDEAYACGSWVDAIQTPWFGGYA
ncbi:MAG: hypothetical protein V4712_15260 [Pseudomonadota bacterium]